MRKFQRKIEDFTCEQCGRAVTGNGYTNHCPACLYSKHVDVAPGDRAAECGGLMRPIGSELKSGAYYVLHECARCGFRRKNRIGDDEMAALIRFNRSLQ
jgi:ribosomal protein L37E